MAMTLSDLHAHVQGSSAFRRRRRLQPAGGAGDKLFPPTYPGEDKNSPARHVFERRRVDGREAWCVLLDSVQSQANRLEEALLRAATEARIALPRLVVDFSPSGLGGIGAISSLEAPHRVFDAILRDSLLDGAPLARTKLGEALRRATPRDASAIMEASPSALLFGAWNSTGEGGGLGAKFARAIVSEIIAIDVPVEEMAPDRRTGVAEIRTAGRRSGSRIDPLGVLRSVEVFKGTAGWDVTKEGAGQGAKQARPSEVNHGNIAPSIAALGVTCAYAEQTAVITLAGLRHLRFGGAPARDIAARALLAAMGLVALIEQDAQGYALRSRCDLVCEGPSPLEAVSFDGTTAPIQFTRDTAAALYEEAMVAAQAEGFTLDPQPVRLLPQDKLVHIVRESMNKALADEAEGDDAGG